MRKLIELLVIILGYATGYFLAMHYIPITVYPNGEERVLLCTSTGLMSTIIVFYLYLIIKSYLE